jgi:hypothetical protein
MQTLRLESTQEPISPFLREKIVNEMEWLIKHSESLNQQVNFFRSKFQEAEQEIKKWTGRYEMESKRHEQSFYREVDSQKKLKEKSKKLKVKMLNKTKIQRLTKEWSSAIRQAQRVQRTERGGLSNLLLHSSIQLVVDMIQKQYPLAILFLSVIETDNNSFLKKDNSKLKVEKN